MYNFEFIRYYNTDSDIHKSNSFYKLLCLLIFMFSVIFCNNIINMFLLYLFIFLLINMSLIPIKNYLRNLFFIIPIVLFVMFIESLLHYNILFVIISISKWILMFLYLLLLIYTTKIRDLNCGLERFMKPLELFSINIKKISFKITNSIQYLLVVFKKFNEVKKSQVSRGQSFAQDINSNFLKLKSIFPSVIYLSNKRMGVVSKVMTIRLHNNKEIMKKDNSNSSDSVIIFLHIFLLIAYMFVEVFL